MTHFGFIPGRPPSRPADLGLACEPLAPAAGLICMLLIGPLVCAADAPREAASPARQAPGTTAREAPRAAAPAVVSWPQTRYLCFSNSAIVPAIRVSAPEQAVRAGQFGAIPLPALSALTGVQAKPMAGELGVPTGLIVRTARAASAGSAADAQQFAQQLRTAVIDFRFLLAELTCYHPPAAQEPAKRAALLELLEGDLPKVWAYYRALPWPAPPSSYRLVKAP